MIDKETAMSTPETTHEIKMNPAELYREIVFTDNRIGTIRQMQPVTIDGSVDAERISRFSARPS